MSYLGNVNSAEGLHTADAKVQAVVEAPEPRNVTELRSFIGMVNYYGKFIPNVVTTLPPLYIPVTTEVDSLALGIQMERCIPRHQGTVTIRSSFDTF